MPRWLPWICGAALAVVTATGRAREKSVPNLPMAQLQAAARYSAAENGSAFLVIQHGKVLLRDFPHGQDPNQPLRIFSGTKFFWCLAALAAQEDGWLRLDERVAETLPEWSGSGSKSKITLAQLLDFTAGVAEMDSLHQDGITDRDALAVKQPLATSPGSAFIYGPAALQVFHAVLKRKLAAKKMSPTRYLERRVLKPLGLGPQRYVADKSGNPLLAAGFMLTAEQWSRMGTLILHRGSPVVSAESFNRCLTGSGQNPAYNLGIWNNRLAGRRGAREVDVQKQLESKWQKQDWHAGCLCHDAPADLMACIGSHGQRLYVVPSMELIVVRMGFRSSFRDSALLRTLFVR